ncbi:hypothetical protein P22_0947 [Propionispora sp. 2/2-37]|uniref:MotA/TolQ/ExbB proton channel family protein n=1 Tax=Propionispora sp. 2/2-37 TaxID=1677858 RepID=UPI0006BB70D7|nr:MotA/TolQ/ExbB proton channel family protein [Propionispora sp. 2/2-37]CUH94881.1 hypothetical protein P22_0947 [Propionispora sp. 2/2-37]
MQFLTVGIELFHKGGPVMYLLLLCSIVVLAVAIERFIYFRNAKTDATVFVEQLVKDIENKKFNHILERYAQTSKPLELLAVEGITAYQQKQNVETALESTAQLVAAHLRKPLPFLSTIVTVAPLFGLLGTVIGMIQSFSVFNVENGQPMAITGGVGEALVATATGLTVAIVALFAHTYFTHRLDEFVTDMEQVCAKIIRYLPKQNAGRGQNNEVA